MKLHTYNYIKQCLEMGHIVHVAHNNVDLGIETLVLETIGDLPGRDVLEFIQHPHIEITPRTPKLLQPGDKCVIIDTEETRKWAESYGWDTETIDLLGSVQTVYDVSSTGYYTFMVVPFFKIPYFMVAPVRPEENKLADVDTDKIVELVQCVVNAYTVPGINPMYHEWSKRRLDNEWGTLAEALKKLVKELESRGLLVDGKVLRCGYESAMERR